MQSLESSRKRKYKLDRLEYLDQLVIEFQTTKSKDAKEQVLANLANFAYDPFNFNYFRQLNILDLFLDNLSESEETLVKFSIGGLCNLCLDQANKEYLTKNGLGKIKNLLNHGNEDIMLSAITTLMFLVTPEAKPEITSADVIGSMVKLSQGKNTRLGNLATIFLQDLCSEDQIQKASKQSVRQARSYSLKVGDKVSVKRKISVEDVKKFADLTEDHNPIHFDPERGIVHGAFLNGLVSGVIGTALPGFGTVVVHQDLRFPKPCYVGSEVTIDVKVTSVRKITEVVFQVYNADEVKEEQVVLEGTAKLLIPFHQDSMKFRKEPNSYGHNYTNSESR